VPQTEDLAMPCYYAVCKCLGEKGLPDTAKSRKKSALVYLALYLTHDNPAQMVFFGFKKKCTHNCNCNCRPLILKVTRTIFADFCFYSIPFRMQLAGFPLYTYIVSATVHQFVGTPCL
jgi:hypothetical protein